MPRVLGQERANPRTSKNFFKAVFQATLLFGAESWVMSPHIGRTLGGFHYRVACLLAKMQLNRDEAGRWIYLPLDAAMKTMGMEEVDIYVLRR